MAKKKIAKKNNKKTKVRVKKAASKKPKLKSTKVGAKKQARLKGSASPNSMARTDKRSSVSRPDGPGIEAETSPETTGVDTNVEIAKGSGGETFETDSRPK